MIQSMIERQQLINAALGNRRVSAVDVRKIALAPGQKTGRHLHPCPVVGYMVSGTAVFRIEGEPVQQLTAGSAFHEPAEKVIAEFSNGSNEVPLTFIGFYLLDGEQDLITMLPAN